MKEQSNKQYNRIEAALSYLQNNFQLQPNLDDVAKYLNLSPYHFQKLFIEWAGVSPKKFLQYTTISYAKKKLKEEQTSILDTAFEVGLSGSSRLHDLFINVEGMTPGEFKNGGRQLKIEYSFFESLFGTIFCASTPKGICTLTFTDNSLESFFIDELKKNFPNAELKKNRNDQHYNAIKFFQMDWTNLNKVKLHLKGTRFQLKVWEALLKIPFGKLKNYGEIAKTISSPKASRAVGSAIGDNPVAFLIPCHRVIQSSGSFGGYRWGNLRKMAMIGWEGSQLDNV